MVIAAIEKLEPTRKCYRLVGEVLVERTVAEVMPAVQKNKEGVREKNFYFSFSFFLTSKIFLKKKIFNIIESMKQDLNKLGEELNNFIVKYKIQFKGDPVQQDQQPKEEKEQKNTTSTGVLV